MKDREHEGLDIHEMERRVAAALIDLVDAPGERQRITPKLLSARTNLPQRRVREITDEWNLQTLSGDEYWLRSGSLERARALCAEPARSQD
jgi:hypothetical protein